MKTKPVHTFNIDTDSYYASANSFFIMDNEYYPSMVETKRYINLPKLVDFITKEYSHYKPPVTTYITNFDGTLCLSKGLYFLKKDLLFEINISDYEILSNGDNEEEDSEHLYSRHRSKPRQIEKVKDVYNIDINILHGQDIKVEELQELINKVLKFKQEPKQKGELNYLCSDDTGLILKPLKIRKVDIDLELNYGSKFPELHSYITEKLVGEDNSSKGLVLFHGIPGSGKTYYIRHLINELSDKKKIIYIAPDMVAQISDPKFLPFLMQHKNSILVVEDGENILKSRKGGANHGVANLLNLADGLLGDGLGIQLICTFNCAVSDIDEALLRKGRLIAKHEFNKLPKKDAQAVIDSLDIDLKATGDMSLAEIYNSKDKSFTESKKGVGFNI
jgi:SpoVK/Ycf46/Vps4 family AAA+-type ATPase